MPRNLPHRNKTTISLGLLGTKLTCVNSANRQHGTMPRRFLGVRRPPASGGHSPGTMPASWRVTTPVGAIDTRSKEYACSPPPSFTTTVNTSVSHSLDLVAEAGEAVQANQFLVVDNGDDALIDPGGNMTYHALYMTMSRYVPPKKLRYVCASHADPDIIASLARWIMAPTASWSFPASGRAFFCRTSAPAPAPRAASWRSRTRAPSCRSARAACMWIPAHFPCLGGQLPVLRPVAKILFSATSASLDAAQDLRSASYPTLPATSRTWRAFTVATWCRTRFAACGHAHGAPARRINDRAAARPVLQRQRRCATSSSTGIDNLPVALI